MTLNLSKVSDVYFDKLFVGTRAGTILETDGKVLMVDKYTTPVISMCYTQTQLLSNEVILVEMIEIQGTLKYMKNLACIVYIKPIEESITWLIKELHSPHYGSYQLYFNNTISKNQLERIAEADEYEVINNVTELFQDYLVINDNLFISNFNSQLTILEESNEIISLLLAFKQCPIIKFESNSIETRKLASEILYNINLNSNNNLFEDLNKYSDRPPILLLLDRNNDPITPLITPWTYQSMIHEFIGINKNTIQLPNTPEQYVISESQDKFFKDSMYLNYGDLTENFQKNVEEYKSLTKLTSFDNLKTQNLSELKQQLTKFPEYKKLSSNILKHLGIIGEIDNQISVQHLWEIGELQQTIICAMDNYQNLKQRLFAILDNIQVSTNHKIKLILLFQFRFHEHNDLTSLTKKLNDPATTNPLPTVSQIALLKNFSSMFDTKFKSSNNQQASKNIASLFNKKINITNLFNNQRDEHNDNIYMQYIPYLNNVLENLIHPQESKRSGLTTLVPDSLIKQYGSNIPHDIQNIIIYFKGGVTYEESRLVHELNKANNSLNLIIGGTKIHNSQTWLEAMYDMINGISQNNTSSTTRDRKSELRDLL
jgi:vacuolar protein sorting-associated protein 45